MSWRVLLVALPLLLFFVQTTVARALPSQRVTGGTAASDKFYIFGYGSLLYDFSRIKTNCAISGINEAAIGALETVLSISKVGDNLLAGCDNRGIQPVRVRGIRRGWYAPGVYSNALQKVLGDDTFTRSAFAVVPTYLGAVLDKRYSVTGLVYEVTKEQFNRTVAREQGAGYIVADIPMRDIEPLGGTPAPNGRVVFFANPTNSVSLPSSRKPICSSYIDVWLAGAIKVQQQYNLTGRAYQASSPIKAADFVSETIKTTYGWKPFWVNDRYPVYRGFVTVPFTERIDLALYNNVDHNILRSISFT